VTLYGHFASRTELVDAMFADTLERADRSLDAVDLAGDPRQALIRLIDSSWRIIDELRSLLVAAQRALPPERVRDLHDGPMRRIRRLIDRGQAEGAFRADLPTGWLVAVFYGVLHTAADELTAGRLHGPDAADAVTATLLAAFAEPGDTPSPPPAASDDT
jgi:AcrR family transcriptional regulator